MEKYCAKRAAFGIICMVCGGLIVFGIALAAPHETLAILLWVVSPIGVFMVLIGMIISLKEFEKYIYGPPHVRKGALMEKKRLFAGIASLSAGLLIMLCFWVIAPVGGWGVLDWDPIPQAIGWILMILGGILIMIGLLVIINESEKMR